MFFNREFFHYFSLLGFLGFLIAGNILVFVYLYKLFRKYFFESDIVFIIFVCIGVFSGFYNAYRTIMKK